MLWYIIGYSAMPVIMLSGFFVTAVVACFLVDACGKSYTNDLL